MNSPTRSGRSSRTPTQAAERSVPSPDGFSQVASSRARSGFAMPHQGLFIPFYGTSLLCAVLDAQQDASTVGLYEDFAAQKIQATFRMYCERCRFLHTKRSVETIQRLYRGHKERMSVHAVRSSGKEAFQLAMFDYYASRIQACFRGFWHRLHVDSFYAKKRYLHEVTTQSYEVLGMAQRATEEQSATMATEKRAQENHKYVRATERAHHVLSTSSISGVYRRAPGESGERTVWATNVEEDIRINATNARKAVLQRKLDSVHASTRTSPSAMHSHGTSPSPAKKAEGKQSPQLIVFSPTNGDGVEASSPGSRSVATPQRDPTGEANVSGVMAPNSASGGGDGAGATGEEPVVLPPIRPTRKEHQRAIHTIPCSSLKPTCYWEAEEAQPRQRPVIAPVHCATVKDARDTPYTRAANRRAESFALRGLAKCEATWPMVSSFHPTFDTPAHDCVEAGAVSTYDGEIAKVRRDVNSKMIQSLHGKAPFKVPASGR